MTGRRSNKTVLKNFKHSFFHRRKISTGLGWLFLQNGSASGGNVGRCKKAAFFGSNSTNCASLVL